MTDATEIAKDCGRAEELSAAATPGVWGVVPESHGKWSRIGTSHGAGVCVGERGEEYQFPHPLGPYRELAERVPNRDARFIAESRTLLPRLAAACRELLAEREAVYRAVPAPLDAVAHISLSQLVATRFVTVEEFNEACGRLEAERGRLREALTWAVGFIRCNSPRAGEQYEDMRNAEALVAAAPLHAGEFQRASARAELAEAERDRLEKQLALEREANAALRGG